MMTLQDFLGRVSSLRFVEGSKFQRQRRSRDGGFGDRFKRVLDRHRGLASPARCVERYQSRQDDASRAPSSRRLDEAFR